MGSTPQGPYGRPPSGQPAAMDPRDFTPAARRPELFGQGLRELWGVPKVITIQTPKAGQEWLYTHSGPSWFVIASAVATFTTSAVVANRSVTVAVKYTGVLCGVFAGVIQQTAGQVLTYTISPAAQSIASSGLVPIVIPDSYVIKDAMTIGTLTPAIDVGDQYSAIALYVYEFTDKCLEML
jgi:hypothetical protein